MKQLWHIAEFLRSFQSRLRHGNFSRAPLRLLRFELCAGEAKCDWVSRSEDPWDRDLPRETWEHNVSMQAIQDAMTLREVIFELLPDVQSAELRAFRQSAREPPGLVIAGNFCRNAWPIPKVSSPVMRAKLHGFQFSMEDGILQPLENEERNIEFAARGLDGYPFTERSQSEI